MAKADTSSIFTQPSGTVALSGIDALARLSLDQVRADRQRGLNTVTCSRHGSGPDAGGGAP